jgi:hypothetical protein
MGSKHEGKEANIAFIWTDQMSGAILIRTPYKEAFVGELKTKIPKGSRRWKPVERVWEIEPQFAEAVIRILRTYYTDVREHEKMYAATDDPLSAGDPFGELLRLASLETLRKIFRMVAADVHPDRGGSDEKMATANRMWDEIKRITPGL